MNLRVAGDLTVAILMFFATVPLLPTKAQELPAAAPGLAESAGALLAVEAAGGEGLADLGTKVAVAAFIVLCAGVPLVDCIAGRGGTMDDVREGTDVEYPSGRCSDLKTEGNRTVSKPSSRKPGCAGSVSRRDIREAALRSCL